MKKHCSLFMMTAILFCSAYGQEEPSGENAGTAPRRFWAGFNYTYSQADMKLFARTEHAIWQGLDYGTDTLTRDQVSSINSIARFTSENNALMLEAGMKLMESKEKGWNIDGAVLFGITKTMYETMDRDLERTDLLVESPFTRLCAGAELRVAYAFNAHWSLIAAPMFSYSWGTSTDIVDRLDEPMLNFTEDRQETSGSIISRVSLMAGYRIKGFTISAGPGFYLLYNNRTYSVTRTNPETGSTFFNESRSVYYNDGFIDGAINIGWDIIPALNVNLYCGIGNDILIHPGIRYRF